MDGGLDSNPKIWRAGRAGREIFLFLLRRNALLEAHGEIPAANVDPEYLATQLQMSVTESNDGVTGAVTAGLIEISGDVIRFVGWDETWAGPMSNAERQASFKNRHKQLHIDTRKSNEKVTAGNGAPLPETESNRLRGEEIREEKRREEKRTQPNSNASWGDFRSDGLAEGTFAGQPEKKPRRKPGLAGASADELGIIERVLERLSDRSGRSYSPKTETHAQRILRLLRLGHSEGDIRMVVWDRANAWSGNEKMQPYLRPHTLFSPEKFPDYLAEAIAADAADKREEQSRTSPAPSELCSDFFDGLDYGT